jgi:site-specific DNA recombinase
MARPLPVIGYIRVSQVGGRGGDSFISPELQRESIERVCARENLEVTDWVEEFDASGGDPTREGWQWAIAEVEGGRARGIVVWNLSRFSRSVKDALSAIERVESAGGRLYSEEGNLDKLSRTIRFAVAEDERDRAKAAFRSAQINAIQRGIYIASRVPFGYKRAESRKLVPDPETAPIVIELFERRAKGTSWAQISRWAVETHGRYFSRPALRCIIANAAYLGHAHYGDLVNEKAHRPLVSKLLWDKAHAAAGRKPVHTGRSKSLLLRGIVSCASCGHKMQCGSSKGRRKVIVSTYQCGNLACTDRAAAVVPYIDEYIAVAILGLP